MKAILFIDSYSVQCHLGCTSIEQESSQEIRVSIKLQFFELPMACESDRLEDTICYEDICETIKHMATTQCFHTIEHLSWELHRELQGFLPKEVKFSLQVHKVYPPIEGLKGGVSFQVGEPL